MGQRRVTEPPEEVEESAFPVKTDNEYAIGSGTNLPNHTTTLAGRGNFVQFGMGPKAFRTRQEVYRVCAWLLTAADTLPDEDEEHTFEEVMEAIQNM